MYGRAVRAAWLAWSASIWVVSLGWDGELDPPPSAAMTNGRLQAAQRGDAACGTKDDVKGPIIVIWYPLMDITV